MLPTISTADAAEPAQEIFILADGRELTGFYDEAAGVIKIQMGRITGAVPVKADEIISRKPVAELPEQDKPEPVRLILKDGRVLDGYHDAEAGTLTLLGKIPATITVRSDDIERQESIPTSTEQTAADPQAVAIKQQSDELAKLIEQLGIAKATLIKLQDEGKVLHEDYQKLLQVHATDKQAKSAAREAYRVALAKRDAYMADHRGKPVPDKLQEPVAEHEQLLRDLTIAVQRQAREITIFEKAVEQNRIDVQMWTEYVATHEQAVAKGRAEAGKTK